MNYFKILNIEPTTDKMAIRRAYVREIKKHHPDSGGQADQFNLIHAAYHALVDKQDTYKVIHTEIQVPLTELLTGATTTVLLDHGMIFEFKIPAFTWPGSVITFKDRRLTKYEIHVKVLEIISKDYLRLDSNVVIQKQINTIEATDGIQLKVVNFDNTIYSIDIPANTSADKLIYNIDDQGFYEKKSKKRGNLIVIIQVQKERS